jgi:hypothetical protein
MTSLVSMKLVTCFAGVNDTSEEFFAGVVDTGEAL